ncbi:hypothetical protein [Glycomyces artemisiae]|uniref:Uncharacterized protein n=1 Tax=Glycomyces artemisiae TaxID=1076443 RepID=A0A2T0ULZ8_9ACTN|nr:hypothetical protein [Glycomyces artemisiae]PRY58952.1 hypothetical protein B0I28_104107 [Glycomyces artemisiae]
MIKKWVARAAVTAAAGIAMIAGITSPAYAADTVYDLVYQDILVGDMWHIDDGDKFRVYDWYKDGHGIEGTLQVWIISSSKWADKESAYNNTGAGTYVGFQNDVLNGFTYRMKVCLQDGASDTTPIKCGYKTFGE